MGGRVVIQVISSHS